MQRRFYHCVISNFCFSKKDLTTVYTEANMKKFSELLQHGFEVGF